MRPILLALATLGIFTSTAAAQVRLRDIATLHLGKGNELSVSASDQGRVVVFAEHDGFEHAEVYVNPDSLGSWLDTTRAIVTAAPPSDSRERVLYMSPSLHESMLVHGQSVSTGTYLYLGREAGGDAPGIDITIDGESILSVTVSLTAAQYRAFATALRLAIPATREMTPAAIANAGRGEDADQDTTTVPMYGATGAVRISTEQTYYSFQVESQAMASAGNPAPVYPAALKASRVDGEVLAQFVVDTSGRVDMTTFKALKATNDQFTDAVRQVLPAWKFFPAETGGHPVRQLVQMPFSFTPH